MAITGTGAISRSAFQLMANVSTTETAEYELIGDKVEELGISMNPSVTTVKDITGNTTTTLDGYENQTDVSPMKAKKDSKLFAILYDIVKNEKILSDVEKTFLIVNIFDETGTGEAVTYAAWTQKGVVAVQSYGGGTSGLDLPFNIHWTGKRTHGQFNPITKTFTANV